MSENDGDNSMDPRLMSKLKAGQFDRSFGPVDDDKLPPELKILRDSMRSYDLDGDVLHYEALSRALPPVSTHAGAINEALAALDEAAIAYTMDDGAAVEKLSAARVAVRGVLDSGRPLSAGASFRKAAAINDPLPVPVLRVAGFGGAVLSLGSVCLLSGAGGAAKSTLAASVALDVGTICETADAELGLTRSLSGVFDVRAGPVMIASYEDPAGVVAWRLRKLAALRDLPQPSLDGIRVAGMTGLPLFGPRPNDPPNARPSPLSGWAHLWDSVAEVKPSLVIIDPALDSYVGEANRAESVREYMTALAVEANTPGRECGVLLLAHSRKDARAKGADIYDPGQVSGSGAWHDAARGVLTLTGRGDDRTLAVTKANWGRAYVQLALNPLAEERGAPVGFNAGPLGWVPQEDADADNEAPPARETQPADPRFGGL